jgi:VWFA-related protein
MLLGVSAASLVAQAPKFSSRVDVVRVDVLVTDRGRPVPGLQPADFEIWDEGVRQQVDLATFSDVPVDAILAFDTSESLAGERLAHLREAGHALLNGLKAGDRAGLVTFSHVVSLGCSLTSELRPVRAALDRVKADGETALVDATFAAMMLGEAQAGRTLQLVFSDGVDVSSWLTPEAVLDVARRSDVVVYGVSAGQRGATRFLSDVSEITGGRVLTSASTIDLSSAFTRVLEEFRQRYLLSYVPRGVSKDGWHTLRVRVRDRGYAVKARPGYLAGGAAPQPLASAGLPSSASKAGLAPAAQAGR